MGSFFVGWAPWVVELGGEPGPSLLMQSSGSWLAQSADHSETVNRWAGRLQDEFGSNMWSCSTKCFA